MHHVRSKEKEHFAIELSLKEISLFMCTRLFARANDAKIVRSRDAQCNSENSP